VKKGGEFMPQVIMGVTSGQICAICSGCAFCTFCGPSPAATLGLVGIDGVATLFDAVEEQK